MSALVDNRVALLLYRLLATSALLAFSPFALLHSLAGRRRLGDVRGRLGRALYPDLAGGIWVHSVSVGEVLAARNLLRAFSEKAPETALGLSVTTAAGRQLAEKIVGSEAAVFPFPFDLHAPVEKALSAVRPGLVLLTETEIWPLFIDRATARGIPIALVNGRISERSLRGYRFIRRFFRATLEKIALFAMQTQADAERISALGAPSERILVTGNLKYDLPPAPPFRDAERLREAASGRPILVAASTAEGEEDLLLQAWEALRPPPFLALAPRRPERFDELAQELGKRGLRVLRRTEDAPAKADVYLLDSIGELPSLYRECLIAFVGGSLVRSGGHNPIEAWSASVPVVVGPHTENFREIARAGEKLAILSRVADAEELRRSLETALADPASTRERGTRAARFVEASRGAAEATAKAVLSLRAPQAARQASAP